MVSDTANGSAVVTLVGAVPTYIYQAVIFSFLALAIGLLVFSKK
jgi:hypothetical protein